MRICRCSNLLNTFGASRPISQNLRNYVRTSTTTREAMGLIQRWSWGSRCSARFALTGLSTRLAPGSAKIRVSLSGLTILQRRRASRRPGRTRTRSAAVARTQRRCRSHVDPLRADEAQSPSRVIYRLKSYLCIVHAYRSFTMKLRSHVNKRNCSYKPFVRSGLVCGEDTWARARLPCRSCQSG